MDETAWRIEQRLLQAAAGHLPGRSCLEQTPHRLREVVRPGLQGDSCSARRCFSRKAAILNPECAKGLATEPLLKRSELLLHALGLSFSPEQLLVEARCYEHACSSFEYDLSAAPPLGLNEDDQFEAVITRQMRQLDRNAKLKERAVQAWEFWKRMDTTPTLRKAAARVASVCPSSAPSERVFSMLKTRFTDRNAAQKIDLRTVAALATYNDCYRER